MDKLSEHVAFGGQQTVWRHKSTLMDCAMEFSLFLPPGKGPYPVLWYLSGLTCTQENVTTKAGFQRAAAELCLAVLCPDTSPRGDHVADADSYDLGQGAGFYLTATEPPWDAHYKMDRYILEELTTDAFAHFDLDSRRQSITGHSMGGHGALTMYLKNRDRFASVSAFAPIASVLHAPWGQKALTAYLGGDQTHWHDYDACQLVQRAGGTSDPILIDVGGADPFLHKELKPELFENACAKAGQELILRRQPGYDHSYYFIASFMADHLRHHATALGL